MKRFALASVIALIADVQYAGAQTSSRMLVMPFENITRDSRIVWLGEASAVLLADNLNAFGAGAITREDRRQAFERLQVPPAATLTDATVIRIGQLVGASHAVVGTLKVEGGTLAVHARSIALEPGRIERDVTELGPLPDLYDLFERVARQLAPASTRATAAAAARNPPLAAFEPYIKGLLAGTPATAINYLNAALKASPTYDRARVALWDVYVAQGDHERALAAIDRIPADSAWFRQARFRAGVSQIQLKKYDAAFATYKSLVDQRPDASVLNNLGVVQLRRGGTAETGMPAYYFAKAAETDATEPDYFFNLGYSYWMDHDAGAAIYWLREAVRRDATDGDAHFVLGAALQAAGNNVEATREKELARRLSSIYSEWEKRPGADPVPKELERIKSAIEPTHASRIDEAVSAPGQRDQRELAQFYLERGRRFYEQEHDREALDELSRVLFLSPYQAEAHLLVGRIHLRAGRLREAIDALKISLWSAESPEAHAALARASLDAKDTAAARSEAERALAMDPESAEAKRVLSELR